MLIRGRKTKENEVLTRIQRDDNGFRNRTEQNSRWSRRQNLEARRLENFGVLPFHFMSTLLSSLFPHLSFYHSIRISSAFIILTALWPLRSAGEGTAPVQRVAWVLGCRAFWSEERVVDNVNVVE
jgi:hypothetical protein